MTRPSWLLFDAVLLTMLLLAPGCGGTAPAGEEPLADEAVRGTFVVAHRGASAYAPEHTAAAYRLAIEQADLVLRQQAGLRSGRIRHDRADPAGQARAWPVGSHKSEKSASDVTPPNSDRFKVRVTVPPAVHVTTVELAERRAVSERDSGA